MYQHAMKARDEIEQLYQVFYEYFKSISTKVFN